MGNKYVAFISYNQKDKKWAKWLQYKLEHYRLPSNINEHKDLPKYLRPIFKDTTELIPGNLPKQIQEALYNSKYLIIICSPNSAQSVWVNKEIQYFIELGRIDNIIPFIIKGTPFSPIENCYPPTLSALRAEKELLGTDIRESGRFSALIKVIAKILDIDFDVLWQRHKRILRRQRVLTITSIISMLVFLYFTIVPITLKLTISDNGPQLPTPKDAILIVDGIKYPLSRIDTTLYITTIPAYKKMNSVDLAFNATYFKPFQKSYKLSISKKTQHKIKLQRDSTFEIYCGKVIDIKRNPIDNVKIQIGDNPPIYTNHKGFYSLRIPITKQQIINHIQLSHSKYQTIDKNEIPSTDATFVMFKK